MDSDKVLQLGIRVLRKNLRLLRLDGRLDADKASTRRRRLAQTLESSITAKRRNSRSRMRAELRQQAADIAAARCARHDATRSDAFVHLLWLHSCSGTLGVMNASACRLFHLKKAGASAAHLEIARQDVFADIQEDISLSTLDMARCVSDFGTINTVDMQVVCASCGTRDLTTRTLARLYSEICLRVALASRASCRLRASAFGTMTEHGYIKIVSDVPQPASAL